MFYSVLRTGKSFLLMLILITGCCLSAGVKVTPTPAANTQYADALLLLIKKCIGNTPIEMKNGMLAIGAAPAGGDNAFSAALREVINGPDVEIRVGRNLLRVNIGGFQPRPNGVTTGVQFLDLDDLQKIPFASQCAETLCSALIHEIWEVHISKKNNLTMPRAHLEGIKKGNEILKSQNPTAHGVRMPNCVRRAQAVNRVFEGNCVRHTYEQFVGYDKIDGAKAYMVLTIESLVQLADAAFKDGPKITKVEVETGAGAARKRVVVTNPDPFIQYFNGSIFEMEYENYPGDPDSRPGAFAHDFNNTLFVAEQIKNTIEIRSLNEGAFLGRIEHDLIQNPLGVSHHFFLDEIFVLSSGNARILAFDRTGTLTREIQNPAFQFPIALALEDGRFLDAANPAGDDLGTLIYVGDGETNKVVILTLDGAQVGELSHPDLVGPAGIALAPDGGVYVSSFENDRVFIFNQAGEATAILTDPLLDGPQGVALDIDDLIVSAVYVASKNTKSLVIFNADDSVETLSHPNMVCPFGVTVINEVVSPGVRVEVTEQLIPDPTFVSYLPHFTYLNGLWSTEFTLANASSSDQDIVITAYDQAGAELSGQGFSLPSQGGFCQTVFDLFPGIEAERGWLEIHASTDAVQGIINFTFLPTGGVSSLSTTNKPGARLLFPRLTENGDEVSGFAVVNLADEAQILTLRLTSLEGVRLDEVELELEPREKLVSLLSQFFGETPPEKAVLVIDSELPITGFGITSRDGNATLIAVPAAVLESTR